MMKKIFTTFTGLALAFSLSHAQDVNYKFYPDDPTKAAAFGKDIALDERTMIVADPNSFAPSGDTCAPNRGAVHVYRMNETNDGWMHLQTLSSGEGAIQFGSEIALHRNHLVVTSRNERKPGTEDQTGALYLFRRSGADSLFRLVTKTYADTPWFNNNQWNYSYFYSPCLNDRYIAASVANTNRFWVYRIGADTLIKHRVDQAFSDQGPAAELGITENDVVVGTQINYLNYFKVTQDTIVQTKNGFVTGFVTYDLLKVSGNTVASRMFNSFRQAETSFGISVIGRNGQDSIQATLPQSDYDRWTSVGLKEKQWLFAYSQADSLIYAYKYEAGSYKEANSIYIPEGSTAAFGRKLAVTETLFAANDIADSTQGDRNEGACSPRAGKGAVTTFNTNGFNIVTGLASNQAYSGKALLSPNPLRGETLNISLESAESAEILNATGTIVRKVQVTNGQCAPGPLSRGVYVVRVSSPREVRTSQLIVE